MKIQKGIVKYKDRSDIQCAYGLTDDGKQYYFLDETDTKKFSNGNRIASTALVEAIDPMAKAENVGVIDGNGVVVVPFENRSIRPVNDNVIIVEKAKPTSQSVLDAIELRNDPASATKLVSTPATIKDRMNAQMGVQGEYIFNDQFSEATVCDINGSNLVNGEAYSFISMANDKLYLSKNTAESPISEFSLSTYEMLAPAANAIDVSTAVVDTNVVEDALNSQATPVTEAVAAPVEAVATPEVPVADAAPAETAPVTEEAPTQETVAPVDVQPAVPVADGEVAAPVEAASDNPAVPVAEEAAATPEVPVADAATPAAEAPVSDTAAAEVEIPAAQEGLAAVDVPVADAANEVEVPVADGPASEGFDPSEISTADIPVADESDLPAAEEPTEEATTTEEVTAEETPAEETPASEEEKTEEVENPMDHTTPIDPAAVAEAVGATTNVEDDVLASLEGDDETAEDESEKVTDEAKDDAAPVAEDKDENADSIEESLSSLIDDEEDTLPSVDEDTEAPPIVEEDDLSEFEEIDINDDKEDEVAEEAADETVTEEVPVDEAKFSDNVTSSDDEELAEEVDITNKNSKNTSATPVPIDAETVLATFDKNKNGIIDRDESVVASETKEAYEKYDEPVSALEKAYAPDVYGLPRDTMPSREDYGYATSTLSNYGSNPYPSTGFGNDYSPLTDVKPDRISYDDYPVPMGKDNIMADVARSMSELMRQNKEQRGIISQYQERVEGLEAQNRILSEKFKDQNVRYEALTSKLRSLDEATARLESRNQLLDSRIHDQEKIIASQDRELKALRPQIEGKQDLVRLLADARSLLGNETTSYGGYKEDEGYYRRAA